MLYVALEGQIRVKKVKVRVGNWQGWHSAAGRRIFFLNRFLNLGIKKLPEGSFLGLNGKVVTAD